MYSPIHAFWRFSPVLLPVGHINVWWIKKLIQNMIFDVKFHVESDTIARNSQKIH